MSTPHHQDWNPVVVRGAAGASATARRGPPPATVTFADGEKDGTTLRVKLLASESVRRLQEWRREANLTQRQLDQRCSFPAGTTNKIESRSDGPSTFQLQTLNRLVTGGGLHFG
jgi:DNA-binding XRE family transcriptional regulator